MEPPVILAVAVFCISRPFATFSMVVVPFNVMTLSAPSAFAPVPLSSVVVKATSVASICPPFSANNAACFPLTAPFVFVILAGPSA